MQCHFVHDLMLFDYTYYLILRTGQSPISLDNRRSTVYIYIYTNMKPYKYLKVKNIGRQNANKAIKITKIAV